MDPRGDGQNGWRVVGRPGELESLAARETIWRCLPCVFSLFYVSLIFFDLQSILSLFFLALLPACLPASPPCLQRKLFKDGGEDLERVIVSAYQHYYVANPLHPDIFPAIRKMEAEIVSMCLRMYNNPDGAGTMTSGGTESIIMAIKTYRDWAKSTKGITEPEMCVK